MKNVKYVRAHVDPIKRHFDPIVVVSGNDLIVAHGLASSDLMRLKGSLSEFNQSGLLLVDRKNDRFRFLRFEEIVVAIYPGFREAAEAVRLSVGFDFQLKDIAKINDCASMSKWITLKGFEKISAENAAKAIVPMLENSRLPKVVGPRWWDVIQNLMWEASVFEPLHAVVLLCRTTSENIEISSVIDKLRAMGADLQFMSNSTDRILRRRKSKMTLMDCASLLFPKDNYFEVELSEAAKVLNMPADRLSSHFRGYLIVTDEYVRNLFAARVQ